MSRKAMKRRLEELEQACSEEVPEWPADWPFDEQAKDMLDALLLHRCAGTVQLCTDRQINVLGILHALFRLPGGVGEYTLPSGAVVTLTDNGKEMLSISLSSGVSIEDLPESTRRYVKRIDPAEQPAREVRLRELRLRDGGKKRRLFLEKYEALAVEMVRGRGCVVNGSM